jgi:hypothetical protein
MVDFLRHLICTSPTLLLMEDIPKLKGGFENSERLANLQRFKMESQTI